MLPAARNVIERLKCLLFAVPSSPPQNLSLEVQNSKVCPLDHGGGSGHLTRPDVHVKYQACFGWTVIDFHIWEWPYVIHINLYLWERPSVHVSLHLIILLFGALSYKTVSIALSMTTLPWVLSLLLNHKRPPLSLIGPVLFYFGGGFQQAGVWSEEIRMVLWGSSISSYFWFVSPNRHRLTSCYASVHQYTLTL